MPPTNGCLCPRTQYQALLLHKDRLIFDKSLAISPTTLLLDDNPEEPIHDCLEMLDIIQGMRPDLADIPFTTRNVDLYTDGSSFIQEGTRVTSVHLDLADFLHNNDLRIQEFEVDFSTPCSQLCSVFGNGILPPGYDRCRASDTSDQGSVPLLAASGETVSDTTVVTFPASEASCSPNSLPASPTDTLENLRVIMKGGLNGKSLQTPQGETGSSIETGEGASREQVEPKDIYNARQF
ncbi:hypothetical protein STEG23_017630 [Scotinomys teguina]